MPHTLPSLTRLARPPTPPPPLQSPNLESGIDAAADVRVDFEVVGFESRNHRDQWLSPNGSEAFFGTSERFRTVQKPFLGVRVQLWHDSAGGLWCGSSSTGSVGNLSWRDEVSTF